MLSSAPSAWLWLCRTKALAAAVSLAALATVFLCSHTWSSCLQLFVVVMRHTAGHLCCGGRQPFRGSSTICTTLKSGLWLQAGQAASNCLAPSQSEDRTEMAGCLVFLALLPVCLPGPAAAAPASCGFAGPFGLGGFISLRMARSVCAAHAPACSTSKLPRATRPCSDVTCCALL